MRRSVVAAAVMLTVAISTPVRAQTATARDVLSFLMTNQRVATGDFVKDREATEATRDTIARALLIEMATLPLAGSSGAFTYRFNPDIGTVERVTQSFGPLFVNRVITAGRGQTTMSATFRHAEFIRLSGRELKDRSLVTTANKFRDEAAPFDVEALSLDLKVDTATFAATYGVASMMDVSVAVPIVHVALSGERINTYRGTSLLQATGSATSTGLGDVAVRTKIQLVRTGSGGVGGEIEVRLPTGSVENLSGSGRAALKPSLIVSGGNGRVEGHANAGFVVGGLSKEIAAGAALSVAANDRVTLSVEGVVRYISELHAMQEVTQAHPLVSGVDTIRLLPGADGTTTAMSAVGIRWNVSGPWVVNGYLLTPLTNRGLRPRPSPSISLEYSIVP